MYIYIYVCILRLCRGYIGIIKENGNYYNVIGSILGYNAEGLRIVLDFVHAPFG